MADLSPRTTHMMHLLALGVLRVYYQSKFLYELHYMCLRTGNDKIGDYQSECNPFRQHRRYCCVKTVSQSQSAGQFTKISALNILIQDSPWTRLQSNVLKDYF